jgi:hypothetical protein
MKRFRRLYGGGPLHLLSLIASMLIAGAAVAGWFDSFPGPTAVKVLEWFAGAVIAHDLVLLPLYSLLDRVASGARTTQEPPEHVPGFVFVRIPALLSGLLFLVFFPEILRLGDHTFFVASGLHQRVFLARYLLTCGVLFALSGVAYIALRRRAAGRSRTRPSPARSPRAPGTQASPTPAPPTRTHAGRPPGGTPRS